LFFQGLIGLTSLTASLHMARRNRARP